MLNENIILDTKPDLRSRRKVVQGADCRRTGNTLRKLRLAEERKHHHIYIIHYTLNEHNQLCTDVTRSLNKHKRWEVVEELEEEWNNDCNENNITVESAPVITNTHHFKKPTIRWTEEKLKKRLLKANEDINNDQENVNVTNEPAENNVDTVNNERRKLRMGRKGFVGAKRTDQATEKQAPPCKTKALYEVLKLPQRGVYPLNRVTCRCSFCRQPRTNKGKHKETAMARKLDLML